MPLQELFFSFSGRINRATFWTRAMPILFVYSMITNTVAAIEIYETGQYGVISIVLSLIGIWPALAVNVKRLHDRGRSGWFILIGLIPIVGPIWLLIETWFLGSKPEANRFGEVPTNHASSGAVIGAIATIVIAMIVAVAVVLSVVDISVPADMAYPEATSGESSVEPESVMPDDSEAATSTSN
ncbi:MAG: DUF805 domain-containing protein [Pseudomonadota bacterium]